MVDDKLMSDLDEVLDETITPTPLSDPVITAIFQNAEVSGLAMRSFLAAAMLAFGHMQIAGRKKAFNGGIENGYRFAGVL